METVRTVTKVEVPFGARRCVICVCSFLAAFLPGCLVFMLCPVRVAVLVGAGLLLVWFIWMGLQTDYVESHNELRLYDDYVEVYVEYERRPLVSLNRLCCSVGQMPYYDILHIEVHNDADGLVFVGVGRLVVSDISTGSVVCDTDVSELVLPVGLNQMGSVSEVLVHPEFTGKLKYMP